LPGAALLIYLRGEASSQFISSETEDHMTPALIITHRQMARSPSGHLHVAAVLLQDGRAISRDEVFRLMAAGVIFRTLSPRGESAKVVRIHCGLCRHDYLRTDRDRSREDNLDELPEF
jgi:hypothetical protein